MNEDTSPEILRKLLESNDLVEIRKGISLAKGSKNSNILGLILSIRLFHDDKDIRALAKSVFTFMASSEAKSIVKKYWQAEHRKQTWIWETNWFGKMFAELEKVGINPVYVMIEGLRKNNKIIQINAMENLSKINLSEVKSSVLPIVLEKMISKRYGYNHNFEKEFMAISLLEKIGNDQALGILINSLGNDYKIAEKAVISLAVIGDVRSVVPLIELLEHNFAITRSWQKRTSKEIIDALGKLGDVRAIEPLAKGLDVDLSVDEKTATNEAISNLLDGLDIGDKERKNLLRFLVGEDQGMRVMGVSMLRGMS